MPNNEHHCLDRLEWHADRLSETHAAGPREGGRLDSTLWKVTLKNPDSVRAVRMHA